MHVFTHNEHRVTGYRTLAALASDSPPRASVIASRVPRPGAPRPAETGRDRPRRAARSRDKNPPAESCIRFAPPLFSFWQPQHAVKGRMLAWLAAKSSWAFPLDRALCGRPRRERRGANLRDRSTLLTAHINSVWIRQREFAN